MSLPMGHSSRQGLVETHWQGVGHCLGPLLPKPQAPPPWAGVLASAPPPLLTHSQYVRSIWLLHSMNCHIHNELAARSMICIHLDPQT